MIYEISKEKMKSYLDTQFTTIDEAKSWIIKWMNSSDQILQDGEYKGVCLSVNKMISMISFALGDDVESSFQSKYYWELRDHCDNNIKC